jgi:TPR repeat protein
VVDLLRELKSETDPEPPQLDQPAPVPHIAPKVICGICQQPNELGHKYCGLCGSPLHSSSSAPPPSTSTMASRRGESMLNLEPPSDASYEQQDDSLEWLREKSSHRMSDSEESSGTWKYGLIALAMLLGAFGVLQWVSNRPVAAPPATATATTSPAPSAPQSNQAAPAPVTPEAATAPAQATTSASSIQPEVHHSPVPAQNPVTEAASTQSMVSPPEGGSQELSLAQGYLGGKHGRRDSSEAAKWLWKAVAKQNSTAGVLLSDLYRTGDGVTRNCDQARLLLVAAAKKGAPTAADKLRTLETGGCR